MATKEPTDAILANDDEDVVAFRAARERYWDDSHGTDEAMRLEALDILKKIARRGKFLPQKS